MPEVNWKLLGVAGAAAAVAVYVYSKRQRSVTAISASVVATKDGPASVASPALIEMLGDTLVKDGKTVSTASALRGKKAVLIYFSAHWCGPCRGFTPKLAAAYREYVAGGGADAEVVFLSWDQNDAEFESYFGEMPWAAVPFENKAVRQALGEKLKCDGIPYLVGLGLDGSLLHGADVSLRGVVDSFGARAFPMTPEVVAQRKAELANAAKEATARVGDGSVPISVKRPPSAGSGATSLLDLCKQKGHVILLVGDGDSGDNTYATLAKGAEGADNVAIVYVGWTLYNEQSDHAPFNDRFHSICDPSDEVKELLSTMAGKASPGELTSALSQGPHAVVVSFTGKGLVLSAQNALGRIFERGAKHAPWSDEIEAKLVAADKARMMKLAAEQKDLQALKGTTGMLVKSSTSTPTGSPAELALDAALKRLPSDGVVGLYFSAHWCPPCRSFTPKLAALYNELNEAGKPFEIVFLSSDHTEEGFNDYHASMPWLALPFRDRQTKNDLSKLLGVNGIPMFVLFRRDGTLITKNGREAAGYGAEFFPWDEEMMKKGKAAAAEKARKAEEEAKQAEIKSIEAQKKVGGPAVVLERIHGEPLASVTVDGPGARIIQFPSDPGYFPAYGMKNNKLPYKAGVLYFEFNVISIGNGSTPQIGFALVDQNQFSTESNGAGCGDDDLSWAVDGVRSALWHGGQKVPWADGKDGSKWTDGDVIGLAASTTAGKIAVSKNGSWSPELGLGVAFADEKIKTTALQPGLSGNSGLKLRCAFTKFKYGPPPASTWEGEPLFDA